VSTVGGKVTVHSTQNTVSQCESTSDSSDNEQIQIDYGDEETMQNEQVNKTYVYSISIITTFLIVFLFV
jgi:hypothetical protein